MIYKKILLKEIDERFTDETTSLRIYIAEDNEAITLRPGMIVCPGGGYSFCAPREAEPIALRFLSEGFNCFILDYSVNKKYPAPHLDLALVISYISKHEKEFKLLPNSLSLIGFSAAGHLIGSYGYLYKELAKELNVKEEILKPRSIVMAYPVVTMMKEYTHMGTCEIITGLDNDLIEKLEIVKYVDKDYPPTFIWTTKDDSDVPSINTVMMEETLKNNNVKHQCVVFESGWHGSSLCNRSVFKKGEIQGKMKDLRDWASLAADFVFEVLDN